MYFWHLVTLFAIAYFITLGFGNDDDPFKLEYIDNMMKFIEDMPENPDDDLTSQFFYTMSPSDRIKYCNEAKDFAGLDVVTSITNAPLKLLGNIYQDVLLECRTLPISYLRRPNYSDSHKIIIMIWENRFLKYHFEVLTTKSEPALYLESTGSTDAAFSKNSIDDIFNVGESTSSELRNYRMKHTSVPQKMNKPVKCNRRLSRLEEREAMGMCIAAKRYIHQPNDTNNEAQKVPGWQNDRVEPAQLFDFGEGIGNHVALNCPIIPSMYVYFKNPAAYDENLVIVLIQDE